MNKKYLESSEFYSKRFDNFSTLIIIPVALVIIVFFIISFFCKKEIAIDGFGSIEPLEGVQVIQSTSSKLIRKNYLKENKIVHKNDTLIIYDKGINSSKTMHLKQQKLDLVSKKNKIISKQFGIVHMNEQFENNNYIPVGSEIAKIYPLIDSKKRIEIKSYIPSSDISSVKTGQKLRFKITRNIPKPIIIIGKIKEISVAPIIVNKSSVYIVAATANISKLNSKCVRYGMVGSTSIITGKETFFNYYKNKLLSAR